MWRWLGILVVVGLMLGCTDMWRDTADFFDSGFADDDDDDDDDGDDGDGDQGDLTDDNLNGEWTLNLEDSELDDSIADTVGLETLFGTWNKDDNASDSDDDFLSAIGLEFDSVTVLDVTIPPNPQNFTFSDGTNTVAVFSWTFVDQSAGRIRLTQTNTPDPENAVVTATLADNGTQLTLTDADGNEAVFNIREDLEPTIISYRLQIDGDAQTITTTIIFRTEASTNTTDTIEEDYTISSDANTISLTNQDTQESVEDVPAALTNSNDTLTLTFPGNDDAVDPRSGRGVFER